jgi:pimeloyl-ACP methyl ester carboxylesterase
MNAYDHYLVDVSGMRVHFMRKPGAGPRPAPLILSHGWPWTFWHWSKVIDRLADPAAFGGDPADAFEVIVIGGLRVLDTDAAVHELLEDRGTACQ